MYRKMVTVYSKQERHYLHTRGFWINREGQQVPISSMNYDRLDKLVKMLAAWSMKEDDPMKYLRSLPIFFHVVNHINRLGMNSYHASMFRLASRMDFRDVQNDWTCPSPEELSQMEQSARELEMDFIGE